jgi:DNA polymerase III sliding clamp (beta) subunit (PCNA family)
MQFVIARGALQKELPLFRASSNEEHYSGLANILIESAGETSIRISGTDLDVTIRCDADAEN